MILNKNPSLYYDDVNLEAQPQNLIRSRSEIPRELHRIIVAPMDAIVGYPFAKEALRLGLSVCLHRFCEIEKQIDQYQALLGNNHEHRRLWFSIGLNDDERLKKFLRLANDIGKIDLMNQGNLNILIDVANGYLSSVVEYAKEIKRQYPEINLMVGNVHSLEGCGLYAEIPNVYIRCNIGSGMACITTATTGYGKGQITCAQECSEIQDLYPHKNIKLVLDGGLKNSGDMVKAFGAGADFVMAGGIFARAIEAEHYRLGIKKYWGGASNFQKIRQSKETNAHQEGRVLDVPDDPIPLQKLVEETWGGIASGVSYSGHGTLSDFIGKGAFRVKHSCHR